MKNPVKSLTFFAVVLLMAVSLVYTTGVFAANGTEFPFGESGNIFVEWHHNGYPDDIGGIYTNNGGFGGLSILLVNPTPERMAELRELTGRDIVITACKYSYNEMLRTQNDISAQIARENKIYSVGTGWAITNGEVHGFGESGKEFRVIVGVDESEVDRYSIEFSKRYGDMVVVEKSHPNRTEDFATGNQNNRPWTWWILLPIYGVILVSILSLSILLMKRLHLDKRDK
jgi:hypothetical protein